MPDLPSPCGIIQRWRQRASRILFEIPAHLRQQVSQYRPPLIYYDEPIVFRPFDEHPQDIVEREARYARWPIFDPPYETINWEGDIRPLPGYEAWLQEQAEARVRWDYVIPPFDEMEYEEAEYEEEQDVYNFEVEKEVEQPLVLPYPDEEEDFNFFLNEIL